MPCAVVPGSVFRQHGFAECPCFDALCHCFCEQVAQRCGVLMARSVRTWNSTRAFSSAQYSSTHHGAILRRQATATPYIQNHHIPRYRCARPGTMPDKTLRRSAKRSSTVSPSLSSTAISTSLSACVCPVACEPKRYASCTGCCRKRRSSCGRKVCHEIESVQSSLGRVTHVGHLLQPQKRMIGVLLGSQSSALAFNTYRYASGR